MLDAVLGRLQVGPEGLGEEGDDVRDRRQDQVDEAGDAAAGLHEGLRDDFGADKGDDEAEEDLGHECAFRYGYYRDCDNVHILAQIY